MSELGQLIFEPRGSAFRTGVTGCSTIPIFLNVASEDHIFMLINKTRYWLSP